MTVKSFASKSHRTQKGLSLKWEFTGDKVEQGEDSIQALKGEIHEELQLEIYNIQFPTALEHVYLVFHPVMHAYTCEISSGEPVLTEHVDLNWLPAEELDQLDWAAADILIVEKLMSGRG